MPISNPGGSGNSGGGNGLDILQVQALIDDAIARHGVESDPHSVYVSESELDTINEGSVISIVNLAIANAIQAHNNEDDPHEQYLTPEELSEDGSSAVLEKLKIINSGNDTDLGSIEFENADNRSVIIQPIGTDFNTVVTLNPQYDSGNFDENNQARSYIVTTPYQRHESVTRPIGANEKDRWREMTEDGNYAHSFEWIEYSWGRESTPIDWIFSVSGISATNEIPMPIRPGHLWTIKELCITTGISSPQNASNHWKLRINSYDSANAVTDTIDEFSTSGRVGRQTNLITSGNAFGRSFMNADGDFIEVAGSSFVWQRVGSPGNLTASVKVTYTYIIEG